MTNNVMKWQKKPVVVDVMILNGNLSHQQEVLNWVLTNGGKARPDAYYGGLTIVTLEGEMLANIGDYIIRGVQGEFYPCKPDIFNESYFRVD